MQVEQYQGGPRWWRNAVCKSIREIFPLEPVLKPCHIMSSREEILTEEAFRDTIRVIVVYDHVVKVPIIQLFSKGV